MKLIRKSFLPLLVVVFAFLWLKELTCRRAFEAARQYAYPLDDLTPYSYTTFSFTGIRRANDKITGPGWLVWYGNSTFMPIVAVSILGNVQGSNYEPLDTVLTMTPAERQKKLKAWVQSKRAEQSAAPLPPAPRTGPSEGAR